MSLKNVDLDAVMRRLAERRIEDAMKEGKFDNLQGAGQPVELEDAPAEENARLLWWALRILRNNDFVPDEVRMRKELDGLNAQLADLRDESKLTPLVARINALVYKINTLGTNAMKTGVVGVDLEVERQRLQQRRSA
jgi:hypothetical protein